MDLYYKQEVSVGLLVIAAIAIFIVGTMWLAGTPLGSGGRTEVQIQFEDVSGLAVGDPVLVSGYNVEYSAMTFALFFLGEYLGLYAVSGLGITLFLVRMDDPGLTIQAMPV